MGFRFKHPEKGEHDIDLFWDGEKVYAIEDICPHGLTSLINGDILPCMIVCPAHGAAFNLVTGKNEDGYYDDTKAYPTEIRDGRVCVTVPGEQRS